MYRGSVESPCACDKQVCRGCKTLQDRLIEALNLRDRRVKIRHSGPDSESLISGQAPALLIEPFFGFSPHGQQGTDEPHEQRALACAILLATKDTFPRADTSP